MTPEEIKLWLQDLRNVATCLPPNVQAEERLDAGGQGVVYRGRVEGRPAAIKIYYPGYVEKRVEREVAALRCLSCSSIVPLFWTDSITVDGIPLAVVATSFLVGQSLNKILRTRPLTHDEIGIVAYDCALAIEAMWKLRIVHRDIKPSNIILQNNGRASVIDLGVARHLDHSSLTAPGFSWGTPGYLSPEQMRGARLLTCKSDLFSLGVVLVEASSGRHPTMGDQYRLLGARLHEVLPPMANSWRHALALRSLLELHPTRRPQPAVVLAELAEYAPGA